jgi:methyltransferase (TIGR00027 family)
MQTATPSRTAYRVAIRRAEHQILDHPRVFEDPLSLRIIGSEMASRIVSGRMTRQQRLSPSFRAFMAVRSRYAEDELARSVRSGIRQYVVLGAGLDTFAYRNPHREVGLRVFEVDYPATQEWKREKLQTAGIPVPSELMFVGADFERQSLADALGTVDFRLDVPTFFSWLGVVPYLTERAFEETMRFISRLPARSAVALDYAVPRTSLNLIERLALDALSARVAAAGEPFQLFFHPAQMGVLLREMGFGQIEDLGRDEMNVRYFSGRADRFRVRGNLAHLLCARVGADR